MKRKVMENKFKLASLDRYSFIDDDLTKREADIQKKIRDIAVVERKQNKKVKVGYRKLWIENGKN